MWIRCSAASAALLVGCAAPVVGAGQAAAVAGGIVAQRNGSQPGDPGRIALLVGGRRVEAAVRVDRTTITRGRREVTLLAQRGGLAILTDSYGSRPQGLSRCQAGDEIYARVIDVAARRERYSKLVESCLKPVISGSPAYTVTPDGSAVTFDLLYEPAVTVTLGDHGRVDVVPLPR
ncbi:hypothetical protein [Sphingomonas sp.]|uniref:hypothetical protein n=1 Tax=Sphingomonas sp. TaxID=28214 RepID=UPI003B00C5FF